MVRGYLEIMLLARAHREEIMRQIANERLAARVGDLRKTGAERGLGRALLASLVDRVVGKQTGRAQGAGVASGTRDDAA